MESFDVNYWREGHVNSVGRSLGMETVASPINDNARDIKRKTERTGDARTN